MTTITPAQRRTLRAQAHHLHPVVSISHQGLSEAVVNEIDRSLKAHELIKVKLHGVEREDRDALLEQIGATLRCAPVQQIGNILVLWRQNPPATAAEPAAARRAPETKKQRGETPRRATRQRRSTAK
jgi:RNA-binding protein